MVVMFVFLEDISEGSVRTIIYEVVQFHRVIHPNNETFTFPYEKYKGCLHTLKREHQSLDKGNIPARYFFRLFQYDRTHKRRPYFSILRFNNITRLTDTFVFFVTPKLFLFMMLPVRQIGTANGGCVKLKQVEVGT